MRHTIPAINKKVYMPHRQRVAGMPKRRGSRRAAVYRDYYSSDHRMVGSKLKAVLSIIAALLLLQSLLQVPIFRLRNIDIQGLRYVDADEVRSVIIDDLQRRRLVIFRNDNYFIYSKKELLERLEDGFFLVVHEVRKDFPHTLHIAVQERISAFVVQTAEKYYALDTMGKNVGDVEGPEPGQGIVADERPDTSVKIPLDYLERITTIKDVWERIVARIRIAKFHFTDDDKVIILSTDAGFRVFFDPAQDLPQQIGRLSVFLQDTSLEKPREYIDLRFDDNLFVL